MQFTLMFPKIILYNKIIFIHYLNSETAVSEDFFIEVDFVVYCFTMAIVSVPAIPPSTTAFRET